MCRLGFISSKKKVQIGPLIEGATKYYGRVNRDGIGFSFIEDGGIKTIKSPEQASKFWSKNSDKTSLISNAAIFHVRYASVGSVCAVNTHPISNKQFALAHNGTLHNWQGAKKLLQKRGYKFETSVDSEVLLAAWTIYRESFLEFLKDQGVRGWYTILILSKDGKIRAVTNSGYLVVFRRDNDSIGFSDSAFKNLRNKYKIELNVLYTFKNGRLAKREKLNGWDVNSEIPRTKSKYDDDDEEDSEFWSWLHNIKGSSKTKYI